MFRHLTSGRVDRESVLDIFGDEGPQATQGLKQLVSSGEGLGALHEHTSREGACAVKAGAQCVQAASGGGEVANIH